MIPHAERTLGISRPPRKVPASRVATLNVCTLAYSTYRIHGVYVRFLGHALTDSRCLEIGRAAAGRASGLLESSLCITLKGMVMNKQPPRDGQGPALSPLF